ncbi:MAG TPA: hypothetical protein ENG87_01455 [Candidatus Pacearchaeota archaeon]|nr:hypothetical protein BMS3Abin17_00414 [archaeon BMS3Abin17]HDK42017.1 hypothetical protein [Candidatus Pacearchaeota archaeon]HDZ60275.1 hypothetical protein [Candidatus Pacearchaeota archaeon]
MALENSLKEIKEFILNKYKSNLAGLLVLGSANTGNFKEGESDINTMIFVKEQNNLNYEEELNNLTRELSKYRFQSQYFHSLDSIKEYIQKRKSFSTYLVITSEDGSKTLYSTPEFEKIRQLFKENPLTKTELVEHINEKDKFELDGYMSGESEEKYKDRAYRTTQNLLFHLRRKAQVINYLKTGNLIFDFDKCLSNIDLTSVERKELEGLYRMYEDRTSLSKEQTAEYFGIAKELTNKINNM